VISLFAACQGSLLASTYHCGSVYVLCDDHLLVGICRDFIVGSFALSYCVFYLHLHCVMSLPAYCLGYVWCGHCRYCNDLQS
jgi:hypothetical protein